MRFPNHPAQGQGLLLIVALALIIFITSRAIAQTGSISGTVKSKEGTGLAGANVVVVGTSMGAASDANGRFTIANVPPGSHKVRARFIGYQEWTMEVKVAAGETTRADFALTESAVRMRELVVIGASRFAEKVTEAPAAVTAFTMQTLQRETIGGQVPALLETTPGVDVAASDMFDINVNTRGFNSSLNRRVMILLDGREMSIPFLNATRWDAFSAPLEDLGSLEIVRGPGSALFGANAYAGVINITSPAPSAIVGTKVSVSGGELRMNRVDVRHAGIAGNWSYRANIGRAQTESFARKRTAAADLEYPGLPTERRALVESPLTSLYGSARVDRALGGNRCLTFEGGITKTENEVFVTGVGRVQVLEDAAPWGRVNFAVDRFFAQVTGTGRSTDKQFGLAANVAQRDHSGTFQGEFQHNTTFALGGNKNLRLVWGASHRIQNVDTKGTLTLQKVEENYSGVYAQLQLALSEKLDIIGASRFDRSSLYDSEFSPKAGVVFSPTRDHSFRATFNKAFQSGNYAEYFLSVPAGAPVNLTPLGLGVAPIFAKGNSNLEVEEVAGYEIGYRGILGNKVYLTIDAYRNNLKNFITDLLPGVNQAEYPSIFSTLSPQQQAALNGIPALRPLLPGLTKVNGANAFVFSFTNAGEVNERGLELGINYYAIKEWLIEANATWFDFEVKSQQLGDLLLPNTPDKKFNAGISFNGRKLYGSLKWRHVPSFDWAAGAFVGRIKKYDTFHATLGYQLNNNFRFGVNALNLTDEKHYEIFGGSVLGRRILGNVQATF